jgi:signal transduction histidine kinase
LAEEAAARQQRLQLTVSPQTMHGTVYVSADPERLQLMLDQLLRHALRCTPAGGGVELAVKVQAAGDIEFRVSNYGGSICADELALLFLPFAAAAYRRERTATFVAIPGVTEIDCINGARRLGLVLTRDLAERHGGGLTVENRAGQGSNFRLSLPSAASTAALTAAPAA